MWGQRMVFWVFFVGRSVEDLDLAPHCLFFHAESSPSLGSKVLGRRGFLKGSAPGG